MQEILKEIIQNSRESIPSGTVTRSLPIQPIPGKASICIGVRRCGKTTKLFQIMQEYLDQGVPAENLVHINFFDDRLHALDASTLNLIPDTYFSLYPDKRNREQVCFFFDEIQVVAGWESFVERMLRTEKCDIYITGSSAQMLSREIATRMRGRSLSWELFPFSFSEYAAFLGQEVRPNPSTRERTTLQNIFQRYWAEGGFPETAGLTNDLRIKIHQEYFHAILFRDLIERHDIPHPRALMDLAWRLIDNCASLYSINALTNHLKSLGHKVPKASVSDYLAWFEDAYFLFSVRLYDASLSRSNANPKKIYCIDHAMITSIASGILVNSGHLLENLIFVTLRRRFTNIFYYRTSAGLEVDFIVKERNRPTLLIQVCETMSNPATAARELKALQQAMLEQPDAQSFIITRQETAKIPAELTIPDTVELMPAWKFLVLMDDENISG